MKPDVVVTVFGPLTAYVTPGTGVRLVGYVPDLAAEYAQARFAIVPVYGGTGQQVKIVEAMAHGLAVVALKPAADRSPLRHRETGLVAAKAEEFAESVLELWNNPELCRRLGEAAREVVAAEYHRDRMLRELAGAFEATPGASPGPRRGES
jgi:glycosyltransferase involved in cell wall biosynthesis